MNAWKRFALLCVLSLAAVSSAVAQTFPAQTVKIIVPFPPGGATDILARLVANELGQKWAVPVIIENRAGASGTIGSEQLVRSPQDGYTLMVTATHHVINPSLYKHLQYDTRTAFTPIAEIASVPNVLVVNPSLPVKTVRELIKYAKDKPGVVSFGSTGVGGANHLAGELFKHEAGIDIVHVPYKGEAPALNDLIGGHIPMMFDSLPGVIQHIRSGQLRALGVTSLTRTSAAPDIPTIDESGVKGFDATAWFGMYAPSKMPAELTRKISSDVLDVLRLPRIQTKFAELGADPGTMAEPEFARFVNAEISKWGKVIAAANIKLE